MPTRFDRFLHALTRTQRNHPLGLKVMGTKVLVLLVAAVLVSLTGPVSTAAAWPGHRHGHGHGHAHGEKTDPYPEPTVSSPGRIAAMNQLTQLVVGGGADDRTTLNAYYRFLRDNPVAPHLAEGKGHPTNQAEFVASVKSTLEAYHAEMSALLREENELLEERAEQIRNWKLEHPQAEGEPPVDEELEARIEEQEERIRNAAAWTSWELELKQHWRPVPDLVEPELEYEGAEDEDLVTDNRGSVSRSVAAPNLERGPDHPWAQGCGGSADVTKSTNSDACNQLEFFRKSDGETPCLDLNLAGAPRTVAFDPSTTSRCPVRPSAGQPFGCGASPDATRLFTTSIGCGKPAGHSEGTTACVATPRSEVLGSILGSTAPCLKPPTSGPKPLEPKQGIVDRLAPTSAPGGLGSILTATGPVISKASAPSPLVPGGGLNSPAGGATGGLPGGSPGTGGPQDSSSAEDEGKTTAALSGSSELSRAEEKAARDAERTQEQATQDAERRQRDEEIAAHQAAAVETSATFLRETAAANAAQEKSGKEPDPAPAPPDPAPATSPAPPQSREPEIQETEEVDDTWEEETWVDDTAEVSGAGGDDTGDSTGDDTSDQAGDVSTPEVPAAPPASPEPVQQATSPDPAPEVLPDCAPDVSFMAHCGGTGEPAGDEATLPTPPATHPSDPATEV